MDCGTVIEIDNLHLELSSSDLSSDEEEAQIVQNREWHDSGYSAEGDTSTEPDQSFVDQDQDHVGDHYEDPAQHQDDLDLHLNQYDEDEDMESLEGDDQASLIRALVAEVKGLRHQVASQQQLIEELHKVVIVKSRTVQRENVIQEVPGDRSTVKIGDDVHSILVSRDKFHQILGRSKCGQALLLKTIGPVTGRRIHHSRPSSTTVASKRSTV